MPPSLLRLSPHDWLTSLLPPSLPAFLLTNGYAYLTAHFLVLVEYTLERAFYPELKRVGWWTYVGLGIVVFGQVIRTLAMVHASASFSHHIAVMKKSDHVLVTSGVYACVLPGGP
jgi:protein-S-isoprenylcysteine O-methyltransferase